MTVAISAVPATEPELPAAPVAVEKPLDQFVVEMQEQALSGIGQGSNPAALAGELVDGLRSYFDDARRFGRGSPVDRELREGITDESSSAPSMPEPAQQHAGPAREPLEAAGNSGSKDGMAGRADFKHLKHMMSVVLQSMDFATETTLLVHSTSQVGHSVNTLLKGQ
ncbi:MAG: hypothetical protein FWD68_13360 [Alphaproteobacteria bacterium]|nr:hypothetical protein [Alphaproteobacteria bacterium]